MKKVYALLLILTLCTGLAGCGPTDDENRLFTAKELQNTEMSRHIYWDSGFTVIPLESRGPLAEVLSQVEVVDPIPEEETIDISDGIYLVLDGEGVEYCFCFNDAEEFLSVESPHRYIPLLQVRKMVTKKGEAPEIQAWICSLDAASYSKALNLTYCAGDEVLEDGWGEYEKPDADVLRESEIELFKDTYLAMTYLTYRKAVTDENIRSEIIRIAESAQSYMPSVSLPMSMMLGGDGEPSVLFTYETENGKIEHMISFNNSEVQMDESYLYYDEPVVTISRTVREKEYGVYFIVEQSSFQCVISQDDYRWLWELTQE